MSKQLKSKKGEKKGIEDFLNEADLILMKYPKLLRELKEIGYIICLKKL